VGSRALDATSKDEVDQRPPLRHRLPPGPGRAAPAVAAHQLARIHEATIQLVAEHGYTNLKVRAIVRLAEVSTRAFYEHFASEAMAQAARAQAVASSWTGGDHLSPTCYRGIHRCNLGAVSSYVLRRTFQRPDLSNAEPLGPGSCRRGISGSCRNSKRAKP